MEKNQNKEREHMTWHKNKRKERKQNKSHKKYSQDDVRKNHDTIWSLIMIVMICMNRMETRGNIHNIKNTWNKKGCDEERQRDERTKK